MPPFPYFLELVARHRLLALVIAEVGESDKRRARFATSGATAYRINICRLSGVYDAALSDSPEIPADRRRRRAEIMAQGETTMPATDKGNHFVFGSFRILLSSHIPAAEGPIVGEEFIIGIDGD